MGIIIGTNVPSLSSGVGTFFLAATCTIVCMKEATMRIISRRVRQLREDRGWSQQTLSARTNGQVSPKTISNLENEGGLGRRSVTLPMIEAVAHVFGLEAWQLLLPVEENEEVVSRPQFKKLVRDYAKASATGRTDIEKIADLAAKYRAN